MDSKADMAERLGSPLFSAALEDMLDSGKFDVLQIEGIELASYALDLPSHLHLPIIFDAHNAEWLLQRRAAHNDWQRITRWPAAVYSSLQWPRLQRFERSICLAAQVVLACSEPDARALQALDAHIRASVLPNGVETQRCMPGLTPAVINHPALVFTGKMDYRPNIDAAAWFVKDVWPLVRSQAPTAHVYLVGKNPSPAVHALGQDPQVHVTGYVPEVLPYLAAADCYIAPLRVGGGTRLKLLEALACGLPIVSTTLGAEGLEVNSGQHLLLAQSAEEFAQDVLHLLTDRELAAKLGANARELAVKRYDWEVLLPRLAAAYDALG